MEQALRVLEAMGHQTLQVQTGSQITVNWAAMVIAGVMVAAGVLGPLEMAWNCRYEIYDTLILVFCGLTLIVCAGFIAHAALPNDELRSQYVVTLNDADFLAASQEGIKLEIYDPTTNTYIVRGMQ